MRPLPLLYCVLRSGGEYRVEHVERLRKQVRDCELRVISDTNEVGRLFPGAGYIPMRNRFPGWWAKMEIFDPQIPGDVFYMDLDSLVRGPIRHFAEAPAMHGEDVFLSDFYRPAHLQSSLMFLTEHTRKRVAAAWFGNESAIVRQYAKYRAGQNGDQNFIEDVIGIKFARWQDMLPGQVVSYKVHIRGDNPETIPVGARIVCFHGKPRPWATRWG